MSQQVPNKLLHPVEMIADYHSKMLKLLVSTFDLEIPEEI
ncbi:hypothetical protein mymlan62_gp037 [Flavobacterium phage vB_FspS_mymlan6-2]|uniref:Uncharacterized protein n=9 Tax=Muminvirus TaxID=2843426 RepID=A0A6B9LCW2_9CAUD|nr:hypothetical protein HWC93_gp36 [Flavobacterium phage vB_FspS_mumin9-1]YP_009855105.1 hypothetical protein HWC94_gp37 [Flavobacterium phage vB_FspS_mymlan6-1]QHB39643.1 hypothetical protein mumin61_gp036 [Flavobacterium phage vB_FspS_mumin6-1]QHB39710.1 hypothetical protein mumin62_gp036 [Flavobacterium phage vB_FspS_mumin6-2]QHB39776.1 hypothetical protein mumin63_gp035 [Flavobacterium phage vB_FspS_mumin6-3]QHB39842.1 hypothetical protein mumin64_gp035 [Flavobacterium phage vB_FspS_mumin6